MRALALIVLLGCGSSTGSQRPPAPPVPTSPVVLRTCADAAIGIERATKDLRAPERDMLGPVRQRCLDDGWSAATIECFATLRGDLTACELPEAQRAALVAQVIGHDTSDGALADIVTKLSALQVGIASCDQFVMTVANVMSCTGMAIEQRVSLGNETADFWSLPTAKLTVDAKVRIAEACGESLSALQQQAADVGCMP